MLNIDYQVVSLTQTCIHYKIWFAGFSYHHVSQIRHTHFHMYLFFFLIKLLKTNVFMRCLSFCDWCKITGTWVFLNYWSTGKL